MICEQCKEHHPGTYASGRFCSVSCSRRFSTSLKRQEISTKISDRLRHRRRTLSDTKTCQKCGKEFRHEHTNDKHCVDCRIIRPRVVLLNENDAVEYIKTNGHPPPFGKMRKLLQQTRSHQCVLCKGVTWMGSPIPLTLDHIDGNPENDHPENLRWVCANCDRLLPTFGSKNRGRGRKERKLQKRREANMLKSML